MPHLRIMRVLSQSSVVMSSDSRLLPLAAAAAAAFALVAGVFLVPGFAKAQDNPLAPPTAAAPNCTCPEAQGKPMKPKFAGLGGELDESDEIAALASIQHALSHAADGATYAWQRTNGRLSGIVHPTSSFRNADGDLCRHIVVMLTTGYATKKTEGTACRIAKGRWHLRG